jgi:hypothetical protein
MSARFRIRGNNRRQTLDILSAKPNKRSTPLSRPRINNSLILVICYDASGGFNVLTKGTSPVTFTSLFSVPTGGTRGSTPDLEGLQSDNHRRDLVNLRHKGVL